MSALPVTPASTVSIDVLPNRREVIVTALADLDVSTCAAFGEAVAELRASGFEEVVIDLRDVELIDSSGLRALLVLRNDFRRAGSTLSLVPARPQAQRIFSLTRTTALFDWRPRPV